MALAFVNEGYDIAIHCNTSVGSAEALAEQIEAAGRRATVHQADLADLGAAPPLVASAAEAHEGLCGLIHSASTFERDEFGAVDPVFWSRQMRVNTEAPLFLTQAFHAAVTGPGWVLTMLDSKVRQTTPAFFSYTASKLLLAELTTLLAKACAPKLRVNGIAPGLILRSGQQTDAQFAAVHHANPMERGPTEGDICQMAVALAKAEATTGMIVTVDGGRHFYSPRSAARW